MNATHPLKVILGKIAQTDGLEEILLPALLASVDTHRDVSLLADGAAEAPGLVPSGQVGERIGQVVELAAIEQLGGHVVLEPQGLGDLHLDAHLTAHVLEQLVLCAVDLLRLLDGAMIEPEDDIAIAAIVLEVWASDWDRLICVGRENCEGAGGVKTNALDRFGVDRRLGHHTANTLADALPDISSRLFLSVCQYAKIRRRGRSPVVRSSLSQAAIA